MTDFIGTALQAVQAAAAVATFAWTVAKDRKGGHKTDLKTTTPFGTMPTGVKRHALAAPKRYTVTIDPVLPYSTKGKIKPKKGGGNDFLKALAAYSAAVKGPPPGGTKVGQVPDGMGRVIRSAVVVKKDATMGAPDFFDRYDLAEVGWSFTLKWSLRCTISFDRVMGTDNRAHIDGFQIVSEGQVLQPNHSMLEAVWNLATVTKEGTSGTGEVAGISVRLQTTVSYATKLVPPVTRGFVVWADGEMEVEDVFGKLCPGIVDLRGTDPVPPEMKPGSAEYLEASKPAKRTAEASTTLSDDAWVPNPGRVAEALRAYVKKQYLVHYSDARGQARVQAILDDIDGKRILLFLANEAKLRDTSTAIADRLRNAFKNLDDAERTVEMVRARVVEKFKDYARTPSAVGKPNPDEAKSIATEYLAQLHSLIAELDRVQSDHKERIERLQRRIDSTAVAGLTEVLRVRYGRAESEVSRLVNDNPPKGVLRGWSDKQTAGGRPLVTERTLQIADWLYAESTKTGVSAPPRQGVYEVDWKAITDKLQ